MLNCNQDGKIIFSEEYIGFNDEEAIEKIKELKQFSMEGRLTCCDDDCNAPVVFCHGPVMGSFFRHQKGYGEKCEYNRYSAKRGSFYKLKIMLYKHFSDIGLDVCIDSKIISHHWTDLAIKFPNGRIAAVELTDRHPGGTDYITYHDQYAELGIADFWIIQENASSSETYRGMHVTDMMQYNKNEQRYAIYFDTERELFTVRADIDFKPKYINLIESRYINVELSCDDISISEDGKLTGKFSEEYTRKRNDILTRYFAAEREEDEKIRIREEKQKRLAKKQQAILEEKRKEQERMVKEQAQKEAVERAARIQRQQEEARRKEELEKRRSEDYKAQFISELMDVLEENGVTVIDEKFQRFLEKNDNWLKSCYKSGKDDPIMIAKYNNS